MDIGNAQTTQVAMTDITDEWALRTLGNEAATHGADGLVPVIEIVGFLQVHGAPRGLLLIVIVRNCADTAHITNHENIQEFLGP
ncbi:hypothetical protein [Pseudomonas sp. OHS18]|uniref:hypothetical protein n=1 Tax=Pseudomonas sp. OHS18 TaxID=3399679 RepID=UPI003A864313